MMNWVDSIDTATRSSTLSTVHTKYLGAERKHNVGETGDVVHVMQEDGGGALTSKGTTAVIRSGTGDVALVANGGG